ncbi:hypothetical protein [Jiangella sp. DSM 45060]|uniref:hypothetical protein n=1 Tax=Jiangella sp. DSM 45060 TaxID=1798224 RepID=UPI00087BEC1D|nr:hypothetical protein [Jiangella sp. DSM 45060]SDT69520.1 hypothetical protein SAMN04515669_6033 [Jiangella sp. DSM 45060]
MVTATPHELLIQTVAELALGLRVLRMEVDVAVTGQRRKSAPMNTIDGLNAIVLVLDALVPQVTDRAPGKFGAPDNPNAHSAPFPSPPRISPGQRPK